MKKFTRSLALGLTALVVSGTMLNAQDWREPLADPNVSFYSIQADFYQDWGAKEAQLEQSRQAAANAADKFATNRNALVPAPNMKGGYKQFKRWEYFMEPRVYPSGDMTLVSTTNERFMEYLDTNPDAMWQFERSQPGGANRVGPPSNSLLSSTWTFAGPTGAPAGMGAGRINFVRFDPTNTNTIWVGAPAGGLWKSTNGGASWTTNTDFLTSIGATDVAIDPLNTQNMYLATGDGDAGDTYSIGVLKSTDGGVTWNTSGLTWTVNQGRVISKLLIHPTNPQIVMAFSNVGIWRTTNGGTSWTQVQTTNSFKDAEYKPGDPNTVYAAGTRFWKSIDGGVTWTNTATGLPANTAVDRFAIAVTQDPTGTAYVYVLAGNATNDGFYGFYRSIDSGTTFTTRSTTPNILGWAVAGNDTGGQGWYDLAVAASPTNKDVVVTGGVNIWRSTNGGTNWTINAHWTGANGTYVHADVHDLIFLPGNGTTYFAGCDGGVFKTTNSGPDFADLSNNLCIAQIYRIGLSASTLNYWITGHQDNGTNLKNGAAYTATMGGDGMDCFVDRTNNNTMYGSQYSGSLNRTTNGGANWTAITTGLTGTAPWVTDWEQDPTTANTLYCGRTNMFRSTNQGTSWTQLTALPATPTGTVVDFRIAPSNNQVIYVARATGLFKTINAGAAWTTVTGTLPVGSAAISRVDVHPTNPNYVVVTFSGYSNGNKVYESTNGGTTWTNISTGLPNLPANCVRFMPGTTTNAMYVGCDVGVYYRDNTFTSWQPYFTSLPNVPIFDLEVYQPNGKLRAASYGRGVWEVDIYNPGTLAPIADFTANQTLICAGSSVNFTDMSSFTPTSWAWSFQGGTPATSTAQNPTGITWSAPGTYSVTLTATNGNGSDAETKLAYITVMANPVLPPLVEGFQTATFLPTNWNAKNANNDGMFWNLATVGAASTQSARFDNYNLDVAGARDEMWAPRINLSSASTASMTFDVAYARYSAAYSDTLEVVVSTDCGATWTSVYLNGGTTLATAADQTATIFVPTAGQWRNEPVSLNAFVGQASVLIAFRNRGHYGQALYVDNINITSTVSSLPPVATFTASATTVCAGTPVNFTDASTNSPTSWTWTFPSGTPGTATTQNVTGVVWNTAGTYTVTHTATNLSGTGTTTQVITVNASPTVTATASNATICNGSSTSLTGSGASTYAWMPGSLSGTTVSVSPTTTTTYTVTGTGANGCTSTGNVTVTVNTLPTITTSATSTTICSGNSTTITASGGTTYSWMPGSLTGTSVTVSPTTTTTYTVTGTAANGCTSTSTRLITVNPTPTVTATAATPTICAGSSTTLTGSGASTYAWMPGSLSGTSVTVTPATTTTYTMTGTAANGCTAVQTVLVTVTPAPTVTTTATSTTICSGNSTTITASGATTYTWMPGSLTGTSVTVSPATTTTYTVTGTTAGCTGTSTRLITVNPTPTVTATAGSSTICVGSSTTLTASGASTYSWMPGSLTGTTVTVTPAVTTTYTVTGTSANGCTSVQTVLVNVSPPPTVTVSATATTLCSGSPTTITASGAVTYTWMPGSLTGTSITVSPTTTTTYTVTGTISGCTGTATQLITVNPSPTVAVTTSGTTICSGNSVTLTGSGATSYTWMPGSLSGSPVTVTPATTTTYTLTGTTGLCSSTAVQTINVNASPTVAVTAGTTSICTGGTTTLTGSGAATYLWMPGSLSGTTVSVSPAVTTTYTVTGTAANGCTNVQTITISVGTQPTVTTSASSTSICIGSNTVLTGNGATTYTWMPGSLTGTSVTVAPTTTTTYTVTGSNGPGCSNTSTITVTVNALPTITTTASSTTVCSGSPTTLTASGGVTYLWMPGSLTGTSVVVSPTANTTYTVTGTNAAGCTSTATRAITVNALPTLTVTPSAPSICQGGSVTLVASTTANHTYSWSPTIGLSNPNAATTVASPTVTTTYVITKTRTSTGCARTATVVVTVNPTPVVVASASSTAICAGGNVTLTGTGASTYLWMPGSLTGSSITTTPAVTTTYTVTGTSAAGCTGTQTLTVVVGAQPTVTASSSNNTICEGDSVVLTGSGTTTFNWMPGNLSGSTVTVAPSASTTYTVTGTNGPGCSNTATIAVTVNALPTVAATSSASNSCAGDVITLTGSGASTYAWMPGALSGSPVTDTPTASTTYTVTGTDANGCSNMSTVSVNVNALPAVAAASSVGAVCAGDSVTLTGSGASTYAWMPGALSGSPVNDAPSASTTYTVTGTDANGCSNTSTVSVNVNALPTVAASSSVGTTCAGDTVTLSGSGASTYSWMPGSLSGSPVNDTPTASTSYTVTGTDANGCSNTSTVSVNVNAPPVVTLTLAVDTMCDIDGPTPLSGGSPAGGNYSGPGVTANNFDASSVGAGTYTIVYTYTDVNGCTDSSSQNMVVDVCSGVIENNGTTTINAVPNPSNGDFVLSFAVAGTDDYVLEIHNAIGQVIYSEQLNSFSGQYRKDISLAQYERGLYTIRLRSSSDETVIRIITQ